MIDNTIQVPALTSENIKFITSSVDQADVNKTIDLFNTYNENIKKECANVFVDKANKIQVEAKQIEEKKNIIIIL